MGQGLAGESNADKKTATSRLSYGQEVGRRLEELLPRFNTKKEMALVGGITPDQLSRWFSGEARQSLAGVAQICEKAGASLEWVAFGKSAAENSCADVDSIKAATRTSPARLNVDTLSIILEALFEENTPEKVVENPDRTAEAIAAGYNGLLEKLKVEVGGHKFKLD